MTKPHDTPSEANAEEGDVHVDGPDGIAYSMTPAAALDTSDRLFAAAADAQGQRRVAQQRAAEIRAHRPRKDSDKG